MAIDPASPRAPEPGSPLRRREFRLYFAGNLVSNIGNWLNNVVLGVYMHSLTHSSFWVGVTGLGLFLPVIAFALPAGALADRYDRLKLLRRAQFLSGSLAILLTVLAATGDANRYVVAVISFGFGLGVAIGIPTMQSLVPNLVPPEELPDAIRMNALTFNLARLLGPVVAAAAIATVGTVVAFAINAATFFVLIGALTLIRKPPFEATRSLTRGRARDGVVYAWRHVPTRWMLFAIVAIGITLDPIITLAPALADSLGLGSSGAGWVVAAWGGGAVAMIVVGRAGIRAATEHGLGWIGLLVLAAAMIGLGAARNAPFALSSAFVSGAGYITATMAFTTAIQRAVPDALRGRVSALWTIAFLGPRAVASVLDGAMADAVGPHWTAASFALVALVAALFLRHVEGPKGEPELPPA